MHRLNGKANPPTSVGGGAWGAKAPHTVYEVKYHFVFCPKYRYGVLEGKLKRRLQEMINEVCDMMDIEIIKGRVMEDHVHMCVSVPPKYSPAEVMKRIKGNSSERLFREIPEKDAHWEFIKMAMTSQARMVLFPMQDILGLGAQARFNTPATLKGNWQWRLTPAGLSDEPAVEKLLKLTETSRRG